MPVRFPALLTTIAVFGAATGPSVAQNLPREKAPAAPAAPVSTGAELDPAATERLLKQLSDLQEQLAAKRATHHTGLLPRLREAAANENKAFDLWMEAMKEVEFEKKGKSAADYSDFRNNRAKKERTPEFTAGLRLQARFLSVLVLGAEAATDSGREEAVTGMLGYLDDYTATVKKLGKPPRGLDESALAGPIAKHLRIDRTVNESQAGALIPGKTDEIYEKTIFPYYRGRKLYPELMNAWRKRIDHASQIAASRKSPEAVERFRTEDLPDLQWGQAQDQFESGQQDSAAAAMIGIIRANLGHRSAESWISSLSGKLRTPVLPADPAIAPPAASP